MPTFDFQCGKCKHTFEFARAFGSTEKPACPECGSKKTEKIIAPPAVHFKGSGWYKTDSKTSNAKPVEKTVKKQDSKKETQTDTKGTQGTEATKKETLGETRQKNKQGGSADHGG